jgi:hypothetical protein
MEHDARLIQAHDIDAIRDAVFLAAPFTGLLDRNGEPVFHGKLVEGLLQLGERVPVAGNQQQDRKLGAKRCHAALFNIAAALENRLADILNNARPVATNC